MTDLARFAERARTSTEADARERIARRVSEAREQDFLAAVYALAGSPADPLLNDALAALRILNAGSWRNEDQKLGALTARLTRLCGGDEARAEKLARDAIYNQGV